LGDDKEKQKVDTKETYWDIQQTKAQKGNASTIGKKDTRLRNANNPRRNKIY
jgi:hypothetical protein